MGTTSRTFTPGNFANFYMPQIFGHISHSTLEIFDLDANTISHLVI